MSWLIKSSIGRKLVMSISGLALILFLTFHMSMNLVALFSEEAYNAVCEFLGANWYALVASMGLAVLFIVHIIYAFILTLQNRKARGNDRYDVVDKPKGVEWASQNMMALGVIIVLGIFLHLFNFWAKMQLAEIIGQHDLGIDGVTGPTDGAGLIRYTFSNPIFVVLYLIWLGSLCSTCLTASGAHCTPSASTTASGSSVCVASPTSIRRSSSSASLSS